MFLVNSRLGRFSAASILLPARSYPLEAPLLPKLRGHFAEFLPEKSLEHLRILTPPTCVGLRYGHPMDSHRGFSWQHASDHFVPKEELTIASRS
jgi:hypothetical protein